MIMEQEDVGVIEGNMPVYKRSPMGISEAAKRHIMKQLSNLYNDPMRAVIREYYANAIDSHQKAGVSRPVEVHLPTELHPTFWVRDWGTGMSEEFILDVYNWYGESTKQGEKDSLGHFGFGSKSGFAIASQFSVISYYEGKKYSINFIKAADGSFEGNIVSVRDTDETNGVLVSIPVDQSKVSDFNKTAELFFKYVDPKTVLVNGKHPESIFEVGSLSKLIVDGDVEVWANTNRPSMNNSYSTYAKTYKFLMGGITYDISLSQLNDSLNRLGVSSLAIYDVLFVIPLGAIEIAGTREGVQDTKKTRTILDKCVKLLVDSLKVIIQAKIDVLEDYAQVMKAYNESMRIVVDGSSQYTYKNKPVTEYVQVADGVQCFTRAVGSNISHHIAKKYFFSYEQTIVTGVNSPELFGEKEKNSLLPYVRAVSASVIDFAAVSSIEDLIEDDEAFKITHNSDKTIITYEEFKNVVKEYRAEQRKIAADRKETGAISTSPAPKKEIRIPVLDLEKDSLSWPTVSELKSEDLVYIWSRHMPEPNHWQSNTIRQIVTKNLSSFSGERSDSSYIKLSRTLKVLTSKKKVVLLAGTRTPSYLEKHLPNASCILDEISERLDVFEAALTDEMVKKLETATHHFTVSMRSNIPAEVIPSIEDEELREALFNSPATSADRVAITEYLDKLETVSFSKFDSWALRSRFKYEKGGYKGTDFRIKYPLLEGSIRYITLSGKTLDHLIKYINSTHKDLISEQEAATLKTTKG